MKSLIEAVHDKYSDDEQEGGEDCQFVLYVPRAHQGRRRLPSVLILDHCDICTVGDEKELAVHCAQVRELDLAHNHLTRWDEVYKLLDSLHHLHFLNVSHNALRGDLSLCNDKSFPGLRQLILNNIDIDWSNVASLLHQAPNVEELHISFNHMKTPNCTSQNSRFPKVRKLHHDGNVVENADHLRWISETFPSLQVLKLTKTSLWTLRWGQNAPKSIQGKVRSPCSPGSSSYDPGSHDSHECKGDGQNIACCRPEDSCPVQETLVFPHLKSVNLDHCLIDCWEEIEQLRKWPSLVELRLQTCPLFHKLTEHERRQATIARLPNIRVLNGGGEISSDEREKAERSFLRSFGESSSKSARYAELAAQHGEVAPLANVSFKPQRTVSVWFTYGERRWKDDITVYQTVKELKTRVSSLVGVSYSQLRVFYVDTVAELMRFPHKQLYTYNVQDDDEFIVDVKS